MSIVRSMTTSPWFQRLVIALILINAVLLGLETFERFQPLQDYFLMIYDAILVVFILEAVLKIVAGGSRWYDYFRDGWNVFDFVLILLALLPASGSLAMVARLARLFRVLRLVSAVPELRLIVNTLMRSIPSMGHVVLLMSLIFYIYSIAGFHLFAEHDPQHWGSLGLALLTLFRVVTLEDWTDVMYTAMEAYPLAWIYFVSFVICGTFVVVNLFIAVVLNNLDKAKAEQLEAMRAPANQQQLLEQLNQVQESLADLQAQLRRQGEQQKESSS